MAALRAARTEFSCRTRFCVPVAMDTAREIKEATARFELSPYVRRSAVNEIQTMWRIEPRPEHAVPRVLSSRPTSVFVSFLLPAHVRCSAVSSSYVT
jgi:hypothetical protein